MQIVETMKDPALFGPEFGGPSWAAWRVYLRALFALPPESEADLALYRECTGRETWPTKPAREAWTIGGRRMGKSRIAALSPSSWRPSATGAKCWPPARKRS